MNINIQDEMVGMISDYIEEKLSKTDNESFEKYMKDNKEFSILVKNIKNNILFLNKTNYPTPSEDFLINLKDKIETYENKNKNYWFSSNYQYSISFSFIIIFISLLFINQYYNLKDQSKNSANIKVHKNEKIIMKDTLNIKESDSYQIYQVKGIDKK